MAIRKFTTEMMIKALKNSNGLIAFAARELGCERQTIYNRAAKSKEIQRVIDDARDELCDYAEAGMRIAVLNKEMPAMMYVLSRLGKNRGYVERVESEVSGRGGGAIEVKAFEYGTAVAGIAPRSVGDRESPGDDEGHQLRATLGENPDGG